ncbi:hypothetical protein HAX54_009127, partial [Datura stramonium]|nr:hypothetical protein [Datura stramonium]
MARLKNTGSSLSKLLTYLSAHSNFMAIDPKFSQVRRNILPNSPSTIVAQHGVVEAGHGVQLEGPESRGAYLEGVSLEADVAKDIFTCKKNLTRTNFSLFLLVSISLLFDEVVVLLVLPLLSLDFSLPVSLDDELASEDPL